MTETASPACKWVRTVDRRKKAPPRNYLVGFLIARARARSWKKLRRRLRLGTDDFKLSVVFFFGSWVKLRTAGKGMRMYCTFSLLSSFLLISLSTGRERERVAIPRLLGETAVVTKNQVWFGWLYFEIMLWHPVPIRAGRLAGSRCTLPPVSSQGVSAMWCRALALSYACSEACAWLDSTSRLVRERDPYLQYYT